MSTKYDIRRCTIGDVNEMCKRYHGYGGAGGLAVYAFGVYEDDEIVAAFSWQPPAPGAAASVCPEFPSGVLALSRMVARPKSERALKHISKPLMVQMKKLIDRGRWPVLVTYSDEGLGHNGYVYQCSGWTRTIRRKVKQYTDINSGKRRSTYNNGGCADRSLMIESDAYIQRWEHWVCDKGMAHHWATSNGWRRVDTGKVWRSGNRAFKWIKVED